MKTLLSCLVLSLTVGCETGVKLAENCRTDYVLVIAENAGRPDRFAAAELALHLKEVTGAEFPIVEKAPANGRAIELGTERAKALIGRELLASFADDESAYRVQGPTVAIAGKGDRGTAYGVYAFLERELGCRWYTPTGVNRIPRRGKLNLADGFYREKPAFPVRHVLELAVNDAESGNDMLFQFRNRLNIVGNNWADPVKKEWEGAMVPKMKLLRPGCHSFFDYLPPAKYFKDHPEYYTLGEDGTRRERQLCFATHEMREELFKNFVACAKTQGGKGWLDLSQQDTGGHFCNCEACLALEKKYGSPGGPLFDFLVEYGPKIKAVLPELTLHFLSYHRDATQPPPKMSQPFCDNIATVFAPIDDDISKPISHPNNVISWQHVKDWTKLCRTHVWSYPITYAHDFPVWATLGRNTEDARLYYEAGVECLSPEHDVGHRFGANFYDLQCWLLTQNQRDPYADWRKLRDEFCETVYGPAAQDIVAFEEWLENQYAATKTYVTFIMRPDAFLTPAEIVRWQRHYDGAVVKAGGDADLVLRINQTRICLDYAVLNCWREIGRKVPDHGLDLKTVYERLTRTIRAGFEQRFTRKDKTGRTRHDYCWKSVEQLLEGLKLNYELATKKLADLPEELKGISEDKITVIYPNHPYGNTERVEMADAAAGYAHVERKVRDRNFPFSINVYDSNEKKYTLRTTIAKDQAVRDKFHVYKLGRAGVPSGQVSFVLGASWHLGTQLGRLARPGMVDDEWDLYVSLKFIGDDCGEVYFDRLICVGPYENGKL